MAKKKEEFVQGCPDCEELWRLYTPERVRKIVKRLTKRAQLPDFGEEIIAAIEKRDPR